MIGGGFIHLLFQLFAKFLRIFKVINIRYFIVLLVTKGLCPKVLETYAPTPFLLLLRVRLSKCERRAFRQIV